MRFTKRIYALCDQVSQGETVADIGTDHGYVPMLCVRNGVSPYAIMSDISSGSLSKAVETFNLVGIDADPSCFRVADGLDAIEPGEVDDIIIAGLGGITITEILDADIDKTRSFKKIIMQPRKHSGNLRYYLYTRGFDIISEVLVPEGKFICEVITAVPSDINSRTTDIDESDIRWKYPSSFEEVDYDNLKKRLDWKFSSIDTEIENLCKSKSDNSALIERLNADRVYLEKLLEANKLKG
ncbi:MAG: class I SAM-dependent methyltransferase [Firmicutes bacterium]|nr:class I SAM-dependent methyltransferase [Bacillota bacterium]